MFKRFLTVVFILLSNYSNAVELGNKQTAVIKTSITPKIDGVFTQAEWEGSTKISDFVERTPVVGRQPEYSTEVYISYDEKYLYVAAIAHQPKSQLTANNLVQGKSTWQDDYVALVLDPSNQKNDAYYFQVNPNGIREDGLIENREYIGEWQTIWYAKTSVSEDSWTVEYAIPFQSLSFNAQSEDWGIQLRRRIANPNRQYFWNLNDTQGWGWYANQMGTVSGIKNLDTGKGIEIKPSITFKNFNVGETPNDYKNVQPSFDMFYKLTPALTAALTVNTDFSGTDVDEQQVNLDRFSLFLPEKRDFFLQDAGVFEFGGLAENGRPFFSRRIGLGNSGKPLDIDAGIKLTGKIDDFNLGLLTVQQDSEIDESSLVSVGRARYSINDTGYIGAIITSGNTSTNKQDLTVGFDLRQGFQLENGLNIDSNFWWQRVDNYQQPNDENSAMGFKISLPNDKYNGYLSYMEIGENFDPSLGFVNRKGIKKLDSQLKYRNRTNNDVLNEFSLLGQYRYVTNRNGVKLSERIMLRPIELSFSNNDFTNLTYIKQFERVTTPFKLAGQTNIDTGDYEWNRYGIWYETNDTRPYSLFFWHERGGYFNGDRQGSRLGIKLKPNKYVYLEADYTLNQMQFSDAKFNTKVARFNINFAFNANWAWMNNIQYDNVSDKAGLFSRVKYEPQAGELYQFILSRGFTVNDDMSHFETDFQEVALKGVYSVRF